MNKEQLMQMTSALHHEVLYRLGKVCEETLLLTTSKAVTPKPDRAGGKD